MKKLFISALLLSLSVSLISCSGTNEESGASSTETSEPKTYQTVGNGYGGEVKVNVTIEDDKITNIEIGDNKETAVVSDRSFPIIIERIIEENTPVVDNVSGATFTSYAVKVAVADALTQHGMETESITMATEGEEKEATTGEDVTTDIVIVGAGPSGLSASISAKQTNPDVNVILIEKLDILSGNGKFDMNFFDHFNSQGQADNGREITKEDFLLAKESVDESEERIEVWAETGDTLDIWLRDMGIELNYPYGGETSTSHMAEADQYAGEVIHAGLEKAAKEIGVEIITGTRGNELVLDGDRVIGVNVTNNDNVTYNIMAQNVILATGGFSSNKELLAEYAPGAEAYNTSNQMGTTGDFIPQFEELGYSLINMDRLSIFSTILKGNRQLTGGADVSFTVDNAGNRATNEMLVDQFYITDQAGHDSFYRIQKHVAAEYYTTYNSLEELANDNGIDLEGLKATIDGYNEDENAKREFITDGPLYFAKVEPAVHMTKGGVETNEKAQVLAADKTVVEGLYASGEVTYQSGAYAQSTVFGKIAGEAAASEIE